MIIALAFYLSVLLAMVLGSLGAAARHRPPWSKSPPDEEDELL